MFWIGCLLCVVLSESFLWLKNNPMFSLQYSLSWTQATFPLDMLIAYLYPKIIDFGAIINH